MNRTWLHGLRAGRVPAVRHGAGLRSDHPLLQASEAVHYTGRQWVHVAAVLTGSVIARIEGREWAGPLAGSAAIVLLILTVLLVAHKQRERDYAIELVLEGRETVPIAAVERQRRRLLSDRTRNGLAGNLEDLIRQSASRSGLQMRVAPLPFEPTVLRMVAWGSFATSSGCCGPRGCLPAVSLELSDWSSACLTPVRPRRRCAARGAVPRARSAGEGRYLIASRLA